jgi:hypothetical protein
MQLTYYRLLEGRHIDPPLVEKRLDEDEIISCLRQNGWKLTRRRVKGVVRVTLTKPSPVP